MAAGSCCKKLGAIIGLLKAILSRILFLIHGLICIWRLYLVKEEPLYWCMVLTILLMILELVVTLKVKGAAEWGWFSPSVFLCLAYTVPPIWLLELDLLERRKEHRDKRHHRRSTKNVDFFPGKIPISLDPEKWVRILQQVLLLLLIIGRWLLPKGKISREQLSQLLLIYIGMAADIIELFEAFKETAVMYNWNLTVVILSLWTASLVQFTFVIGTNKISQSSPGHVRKASSASSSRRRSCCSASSRCCCCCCCTADVVSILTSIALQDGPFLVLRMLLIFRYEVLSYTNIFFTSKNTLVILFQMYRLAVLYCENKTKRRENRNGRDEEMDEMKENTAATLKMDAVHGSDACSGQGNAKTGQSEERDCRESKNCCCLSRRDKYHGENFSRYQEDDDEDDEEVEEEDGEVVVIDEDLFEELSESGMLQIVTCPSPNDLKMWECVSTLPSPELCLLDQAKRHHADKMKRRMERIGEEDVHGDAERRQRHRDDRPKCKAAKDTWQTFVSSAEFQMETQSLPISLQKWKGKMKKGSEDRCKESEHFMRAHKETLQTDQEIEPIRQLTKNPDYLRRSLRKDPKSKRPKLYDVAVEVGRQSRLGRVNFAEEQRLNPDLSKMMAFRMMKRCPNCANINNGRHCGQKPRRTPERFAVR